MPSLPKGMFTESRQIDQVFDEAELLYRRVPLVLWDDWNDWNEDIGIESVQLPDISVNREKYSHPVWARFEGDEYKYADWGVVSLRVQDVPTEQLENGVTKFTFKVEHAPLKKNYPHTEVRAFENSRHISLNATIDPIMHLRWREKVARKIRRVIAPHSSHEIPNTK